MSTRTRKPRTRLGVEQLESRDVPATIRITEVPTYGVDGFVHGVVTDVADPSQFRVALYIQIEGVGWWTKPTFESPTVPLGADGTFVADVATGGLDNRATIFAAALVPAGVTPPPAAGGDRIPDSLDPVAIDYVERYGRTIEFAGYTWGVKESPVGVGPEGNHFSDRPDDVFVDESGRLHLTLRSHGGVWWATEVVLLDHFGYGTYSFQTDTDLSALDPNVTFGAFTWDPYGDNEAGANPHREIDFEDGQWGDAGDLTNSQFVVQPHTIPGNLHRTTITSGELTRFLTWTPEQLEFVSLRGHHDPSDYPAGDVIDRFTFAHNPGIDHHVPDPGRASFRFNLWLNGGAPAPADGQTVEVIVSDFAAPRRLAAVGGNTGEVVVFDPVTGTRLLDFRPFDTAASQYLSPMSVALGDVNADGVADLIVATRGRRAGKVKVFDGAGILAGTVTGAQDVAFVGFPLSPDGTAGNNGYKQGLVVASADVNGDGIDDVVVASRTSTSSTDGSTLPAAVVVYSGADGSFGGAVLGSVQPIGTASDGLYVTAGDTDGDGRTEVAVSSSKQSLVKIFRYAGGTFSQVGGDLSPFAGAASVPGNGDGQIRALYVNGGSAVHFVVADHDAATGAVNLKVLNGSGGQVAVSSKGTGATFFALDAIDLLRDRHGRVMLARVTPSGGTAIDLLDPLTGDVTETLNGFLALAGRVSVAGF